MKKLLKSLVLFAAAAMALTSCENEGLNEGIEANDTYTMTFTAGAPESRTSVAIDGTTATYSWSADDKVGFIQSTVVDETPKINKRNSKTITIDGDTATFTTSFDSVDGATSFDYGAFYPGDSWVSNTSFAEVIVKIPASQNYTENSFDPLADLMMAKPILGVTVQDGHGGNLEFARLAAIGKMTLSGVRDGEVIKRVQFSINDAVLSGQVTLDFENITAEYATEGDNYIEVKGDNVGNEIFFTCFPGAYTGTYTIDVETDKAFYQKVHEFTKEFTLTAGNILAFNASVNWVEDKATDKVYTKITNANLADYSGEYLLVCESKNIAFDGSGTTSAALDKDNNTFSVEIVDGTITGDYTAKSFTIAKVDGGYSVLAAGGLYIGNGGTSNGMSENATYSASTYLNTIENCVLKGKGGLAMQVYSSGSTNRFRYYTDGSGKTAVSLYRLNGTGSDEESGETPEPEEPENPGTGGEVTITFNGGAGQKDGLTWEESPITVVANTNGGQYAPNEHSGDSHLRLYNKNTLTFSGATITKIVFTFDTAQTLAASVGTYSNGTWTGSANSVTFTNNAAGQAKITSVTITYGGGSGEGGEEPETPEPVQLATPSVTATVNGTTVNVSWAAVANASSYAVTLGEQTKTVNTTSAEFTGLVAGIYTVSVVAKGDGTNYTDSAAGTASATVEEQQSGEGGTMTLTSDNIQAVGAQWTYTSGTKTITDGSGNVWTCYNIYRTANQTTIQGKKDASSYVLTPTVNGNIKSITISAKGSSAKATIAIQEGDGTAITTQTLTTTDSEYSYDVTSAACSSIKIVCTNATTYISNITVNY